MKLLIIRPSALGDTLMLMPSIAQLKGSTQIVLVGRSPGIDLISPHVNRVIDYEGSGWHRLFLEDLGVDHGLSLPEPDCAVGFLGDPDGIVKENLKTILGKTSLHFFPPFPPEGANLHAASYLAQCLKQGGMPLDPDKCLADADQRALLQRGHQAIQKKRLVFHPGSGGKSKNHPPEFWLELIGELTTDLPSPSFSTSIVLLGPAEEQLLPFFKREVDGGHAEILFAPELEHLQSILSQAPLYVGHDSGITHLAAMLGTPTIALFRMRTVRQWRPLGPAVKVIQSEESSPGLIAKILEEMTPLASNP
ncbi:MAG: glycosyltransferase family 9 protein [Desulfobacteraceae bacterium]|jgi:ADP-heptose:LPS heptosyltransferase